MSESLPPMPAAICGPQHLGKRLRRSNCRLTNLRQSRCTLLMKRVALTHYVRTLLIKRAAVKYSSESQSLKPYPRLLDTAPAGGCTAQIFCPQSLDPRFAQALSPNSRYSACWRRHWHKNTAPAGGGTGTKIPSASRHSDPRFDLSALGA